MEKVDYENVTIQGEDFHIMSILNLRNGTRMELAEKYPNLIKKFPYVTYSGFYFQNFTKCFGLDSFDNRNIVGQFGFNSSVYPDFIRPGSWEKKMAPFTFFHLPNKTFFSKSTIQYNWPKRTNISAHAMEFTLSYIEILKRRSKRSESCVEDNLNYDEIILNEHIDRIGCRAPYQISRTNVPICPTKDKMKQTIINLNASMPLKIPCTSMENVRYTFSEIYSDWSEDPRTFWVQVYAPDRFKEINQVRAVDIQTVFGNAGGYVGLFIGKCGLEDLNFFNCFQFYYNKSYIIRKYVTHRILF
jgi:hypothetical protein